MKSIPFWRQEHGEALVPWCKHRGLEAEPLESLFLIGHFSLRNLSSASFVPYVKER